MVGALRSNRCGTCQKRKIKCDAGWPVCGPCKRGNRECPPRPSLKVIESSLQVEQHVTRPAKRRKESSITKGGVIQIGVEPFHITQGPAVQDDPGDISLPLLLQTTMTPPPSEQLAREFYNCLEHKIPAYSLKIIGAFAWQLPQRFGSSAALDDVAVCLLASHTAIVRGAPPSSRINPKLYNRALRSVQDAINNSNEWGSINTLCAILLLQRIEAIFGESFGSGELVHASGLATLLQLRGAPKTMEKFDCLVISDSHMCIVYQALVQRKYCFIASEEWDAPLSLVGGSRLQTIFCRLLRQMVHWPTLVWGKMDLHNDSTMDPQNLLDKAQHVRRAIDDIGRELEEIIEEGDLVKYIPAAYLLDLVTETFQFRDHMAALLLCYHGMYSIVIYQILLSLGVDYFDESELRSGIRRLSQRIWMLVEYAQQNKPLGLPMLQSALFMTAELVDWDTQTIIMAVMNELDSAQRLHPDPWTRERILHHARILRGDCTSDYYTRLCCGFSLPEAAY